MRDLVKRAKEFAYRAHAGQVDKAGRPYIEHVARVAAAVSDDPVAEAVAWLHDVFEDNPDFVAQNECEFFSFGDPVMASVIAVTRTGHTLEADDFYYLCIRMDEIALRVKLADIADNSNEDRLAMLDEKTANRLRRKYAKAIAALTK